MKKLGETLVVFLLVVFNSFATDYYVSKKGNDKNSGTELKPFLTIQKAADIMKPEDICYIAEGFYPESVSPKNSGTKNKPIIFRALSKNDLVILSGANPILKSKWIRESATIFKAKVEMDLGHENQVFLGQKTLVEARWPNIGEDLLERKTSIMDKGSTPENIIDNNLPDYNFTGGNVWIHAKKYWIDWSSPIVSQGKKSIAIKNLSRFRDHFMKDRLHVAGQGEDYYIFGIKDALDSDNEWFYDKKTKELFIYRADGKLPKEQFYVKQRMNAFDFSDKKNIQLHNVDIIGAAIITNKNSEAILLNELKILYPYYSLQQNELYGNQTSKGIVFKGKKCIIQNSEIGYSTGSCLSVFGEENIVFNNYIHDANMVGSVASCVYLGGKLNVISHNTLTRAGRTVISYSDMYQALIQNNDMSHAGKLTSDLGLTYGNVIEAGNSEVRYNLLHHNDDTHWSMGLYYDHGTQNIISHHNIVWGIQDLAFILDHYAAYHLIYNNTFISKKDGIRSNWGNRYNPDLLECRFANNLLQNPGNTNAGNYYWNSNISGYQDFDDNNVMKPAKEGLAKGIFIEDISASKQQKPGVGAIEYEGMRFKAGHDFENPPKNVNFKRSKPAHRNLIENSAFEKEDFLYPWKMTKGVLLVEHEHQNQTKFDTSIGRMGKRSIELVEANSEISQKITNLKSNKEYTFIGHLRVNNKEAAVLGVRFSNGTEFFGPNVVRGEPNWSRSRLSFVVPENEKVVEVFVRRLSSGKGKIYLDDFGLVLR